VKYDILRWNKRERVAAGPGSNRSRAKARKQAKRRGNKLARRQKPLDTGE
jgi:hypothetical protein